ncbi:alkaline phosphatase [Rhodovulum sulfidophilum]|uniref:alkaline phosphatase n=1 Tax=Rhodovulum sulfidophilum TaxID=35806 RepID=UPI0005A7A21A|nr:alkaline phosphatase [Rhodovulum sulfidophilum]ANB32635.1 alkaline phosphatase [Rhodovulum sulfidophilum DSM 1374]ANB36484.1 alkaline phosphatase [Rhodovulum sulfidophilum]MCW2305588.1 alkaline phosphatase [Rhodovulum sulfidophilum]
MHICKPLLVSLGLSTALVAPAMAQDATAKNVILLITDGAGIETWRAASYYRFGGLGHEVYDDFDVQVFASTHPLTTERQPTMTDEGAVTFDPAELWNAEADSSVYEGNIADYPAYFAGYAYSRADYTDSAAAGTALASGHKTYNSALNWSNNDTRMKHIGEYAVESGRALGSISSVEWTHATPAAFLAHNRSRNNYEEIAQEIIDGGLATVVMGTGHPYFNGNGERVEAPSDKDFRYVGGRDTWNRLVSGETAYKHIETRADFEALANGTLDMGGKDRLIGTAQNVKTLQFNRDGVAMGDLLENVPDLPTMTKGALNVLSQDEDGFFLMIEGGAVDWAAHANNLPRIIEEQIDFNKSVEAVVDWVEANSSWDETLVMVTTDHGNGLLEGPDSDKVAYSPVINQGAGALPLVRWHDDTHTRELVPVYAMGAGAEYLLDVAKPAPGLATYGVSEDSRVYVDNTDVFGAALHAFGLTEALD